MRTATITQMSEYFNNELEDTDLKNYLDRECEITLIFFYEVMNEDSMRGDDLRAVIEATLNMKSKGFDIFSWGQYYMNITFAYRASKLTINTAR